MPEKIGKYQVLERIGRGGMGTIFKAHDPVLDRPVALKVISSEVEVTDELRTRFFREAQACARLSHPNIITVYDMGEDDGRLFIVMELLDGEELRRLIAQRKALALEDKLSIMVQVCDGLHFAHQKGIVHRDIKPGNIMVLPTGQVKILDFGIAQVANTAGGLTRTGLIMGTLRYISPEQVRGHADHRSDMFSVGAVFYELLSFRPPFAGDDPMQLLEQLRTEDPPALSELDPHIPRAVEAIITRAMRKEPAERFGDLDEMRDQLEQVQRGLAEEAQRVRARVREQRDQLRTLQAALAERVGPGRQHEPIPLVDERGRLATMQALERDLAARIDDVHVKIAQAEELTPTLERGFELLASGEFADAVVEFEAIVALMPEHGRAMEGLGQARARAEAQHRRQLAAQLVQDARAALDNGAYSLCLEILKHAGELPPPVETAAEIRALRETAEAALAAQEAARRSRQRAERAQEQMSQARRTALAYAAMPYAPALWQDAETKATDAQAAFARAAYAEAQEAFAAAEAGYRRFEETARKAHLRERDAAERARAQMAQARERAQTAGAPQHAREPWDAAEAKAAGAHAALATQSFARALVIFVEAAALYRQAEDVVGARQQAQRRRAEEARSRAEESRQRAETANAPQHVPALWNEAVAKCSDAESLLARDEYEKAAEAFTVALGIYRRAESQADEARRRLREQSEQGRRIMADCRRSALAAGAGVQAYAAWNEAEASAASGEAAAAREAYAEATGAFEQSATSYRASERLARQAPPAPEITRADAERAREASTVARRGAAEAEAAKYASEQWRAGERKESEASDALDRQDYPAARALFSEARRLYATAAHGAGVAREAESCRVDAMVNDARRLFASREVEACLRRLDDVLALRPGHAMAERLRLRAEGTLRGIEPAPEGELLDSGPQAQGIEQTIRDDEGTAMSSGRLTVGEPTVLAESTLRGEPSTVVGGPPTMASAAGADRTGSEIAASAGEAASGETTRLSFAAARRTPRGERSWRVTLGARGSIVALGALAVIVLAILYWRSPSENPPSSPPLEDLRKEVAAAREEATRAHAERLPDFPLATDKEHGAEAAMGRKDAKTAQQQYGEALFGYRLAKTRAEEANAAARVARTRVTDARKLAEMAEAPQRGPSVWTEAETAQPQAEAALEQHTFDRAQTAFREVERLYRQAAETGVADFRKRELRDLEQARQEAERADAQQFAQKPFALAQQKQDEAGVALDRYDLASAKMAVQEALRLYRQAAQDSATQREKLPRTRAAQARERMTSAQYDAAPAVASQRAPFLLAWAKKKEHAAEAAFGRSEYVLAQQLFDEAQADYEIASREARGAGDSVPSARSNAEQARRRAVTYRERAVKTDAEQRAGDLFIIARGKEVEADELMSLQRFPSAAQAYGEAGDGYLAAARGLGERREADSARSRGQAEKPRRVR